MRVRSIFLLLLAPAFFISCGQGNRIKNNKKAKISFENKEADRRVDVLVDGKLFTSYLWPDSVYKPILYPILTAEGNAVTRGFPISPREGERRDHVHQVGNWLNYGSVNGYDFWGNGSNGKRNVNGGQIVHLKIDKLTPGDGKGSMITTASWIDPSGKELLAEKTEFFFTAKNSLRIIDRVATLTATNGPVSMKDTKEGMFGIRVARQLELPSKEDVTLTDVHGEATTVKKLNNNGVSGNYRSSEGVTGEDVWGTRAKWMDLYGKIGNENVSLVICDHPKNLNYPTYWHARGYGLFAANPFGVKDFTKGKQELNYVIKPGQSITFRYRIIISSDHHLTNDEINSLDQDFAKSY